MKKVYRVTLWHGDKPSQWNSDAQPKIEPNGLVCFKSQDGLSHWIMGSVEITEFEEPS